MKYLQRVGAQVFHILLAGSKDVAPTWKSLFMLECCLRFCVYLYCNGPWPSILSYIYTLPTLIRVRVSFSNLVPELVFSLSSPSSHPQPPWAEYRAVANGVIEAYELRQLLQELHSPLQRAALVYCDNVNAVYHSTNPVQHQHTKHVEINLHFVRERVAGSDVRVLSVPTTMQFADIFTKGLPSSVSAEFRSSLNICTG
jgi:hypothetical protein